jgi:xylitol oxidase
MQNWSRTFEFTATNVHHPSTVDEVQELVARADRIKAVGTRHSFHPLADSATDLISLDELDGAIRIDPGAATVTVPGAVTYGALAPQLDAAGLAVPNLASLPHISVAGAVATATHGSGNHNPNLAAAVRSVTMVVADGTLVTRSRGDDGFDGAVVALGALGIVTSLTLDVVPSFTIRQTVYENLALDRALAAFDEITGLGYSVSYFTDWRAPVINQVWVKQTDGEPVDSIYGAAPAPQQRNPVPGAPAENTTAQLGRRGPWHERLPHFRMEFTPSAGAEIQTEYLVPREHVVAAVSAIAGLAERIAPLLQVCEIRQIAPDQLWLSTAYDQPSVGLHFTWHKREAEVLAVLPAIESALAPFGPRPHWGKVFRIAPALVQARYPRLGEFRELAAGYDPDRKFGNAFLTSYIYG